MAKTALNQLQDQIEAIRSEAYAAGYAAAMQAIRDFAARPSAAAPAPRRAGPGKPTTPAKPAKPVVRRGRRSAAEAPSGPRRRPQRGTNARLIVEVLKAAGPDFVRPAVIRTALQRDKGAAMAFTSIRHALGQLQTRGQVEASADGKTWRYLGAS